MFGMDSLLRIFSRSTAGEAATVQALLDHGKVGILSASCCDPTMQQKDEQLARNVEEAMRRAGDERAIAVATITSVRRQLQALSGNVDEDVARLREQLSALFQGQGLGAFPILLLGGRIAFYGGVPDADSIAQKLGEASQD